MIESTSFAYNEQMQRRVLICASQNGGDLPRQEGIKAKDWSNDNFTRSLVLQA